MEINKNNTMMAIRFIKKDLFKNAAKYFVLDYRLV